MIADQRLRHEEQANVWTHGIALLLGLIGVVYLIIKASQQSFELGVFSAVLFGMSVILLYSASVSYHIAKLYESALSPTLRMVDHIFIYFLIAGSYTPFALLKMNDSSGWRIFYMIWAFALAGTIFKLSFRYKYKYLSILFYVLMGWMIVFDYSTLVSSVSSSTLYLLMAGGAAYSIGVFFYANEKLLFTHAIWHVFVFAGTAFHYFAVLSIYS